MTEAAVNRSPDDNDDAPGPMRAHAQWVNRMLALGARYAHARLGRRGREGGTTANPERIHWPRWPRADEETERVLRDVLYSGKWTLSGASRGEKPYEQRFAEAFARFNGSAYCVPCSSGSAALTLALRALDVPPGSEVIVPGLTWVAVPASVVEVGATPVLVDLDADTLCISLEETRRAVGPRTSAIVLVHAFCALADIAGFLALSKETGVPLVEDCSHMHGAVWKGRRVGSFGRIGLFSMQQSKVLTCGEGGALLTDDPALYRRLQQLRADGRVYAPRHVKDAMDIEKAGEVMGRNYNLSEFHAAILLDRLRHLDAENATREENARILDGQLEEIPGVSPLSRTPGTDRQTYYEYCVRFELERFGSRSIDELAEALTRDLGCAVEPIYEPFTANVLYRPQTLLPDRPELDPARFRLPVAERARRECLALPHHVLLAPREAMGRIARAIRDLARRGEDEAETREARRR